VSVDGPVPDDDRALAAFVVAVEKVDLDGGVVAQILDDLVVAGGVLIPSRRPTGGRA
jgi:hypothetical protein